MAFFKTLLFRRFNSLTNHPSIPDSLNFKSPLRPISSLPPNSQPEQIKKPLSTLFTEVMSPTPNTNNEDEVFDEEGGDTELKKNLKQLTEDIRQRSQKTSLHSLFTEKHATDYSVKEKKVREKVSLKELSFEMGMFVKYLYEKGYFQDTSFVRGKEFFDLAWFDTDYARNYIKFATRRFAKDNQEIAKWLSGSALKQVAVYGCPSNTKGSVFPAKQLRKFFEVPENTVCSKCALQKSCKFMNQSVWNCGTNKLDLDIVMTVITSYALQSVHPELVVSDEVNKSIAQLLEEVVKLSRTI